MPTSRFVLAGRRYTRDELDALSLKALAQRANYEIYILGRGGTGLFHHGIVRLELMGLTTFGAVAANGRDSLSSRIRPVDLDALDSIMELLGLSDQWLKS